MNLARERFLAVTAASDSLLNKTRADYDQMRATGDRLEDKYIVPIARELAEALKAIHEAGIIHRDVKGK